MVNTGTRDRQKTANRRVVELSAERHVGGLESFPSVLVRRGSIVIFPRYQADLRTPVRDFTKNAMAGSFARSKS